MHPRTSGDLTAPRTREPSAASRTATATAWEPRARTALAAFAALTLLPMLGLAGLAFTGAIDGEALQALTPAAMLLPALAAIVVWSTLRTVPLGRALGVRPAGSWRRALGWSLVALAAVAALGLATAAVAVLVGAAQPGDAWRAAMPAIPAVLGTMLALSLAEEVGWRGFALRLLAPIGVVRASLAIAAFWALWHAPSLAVWVWEGTMPLAAAATTLGSLLLGGLVLAALAVLGGSVWPAVVGHAAMNSLVVFATSTLVTGETAPIGAVGLLPWAVAAVVLLLLAVRSLRDRRAAAPSVTE